MCDRPADQQPDLVDRTFLSLSREIADEFDKGLEDESWARVTKAPFLKEPTISNIRELQPFYSGRFSLLIF